MRAAPIRNLETGSEEDEGGSHVVAPAEWHRPACGKRACNALEPAAGQRRQSRS